MRGPQLGRPQRQILWRLFTQPQIRATKPPEAKRELDSDGNPQPWVKDVADVGWVEPTGRYETDMLRMPPSVWVDGAKRSYVLREPAELPDLSASVLSRAASRLQDHGWIRKVEHSSRRRRARWQLTPAGLVVCETFRDELRFASTTTSEKLPPLRWSRCPTVAYATADAGTLRLTVHD